MRFRDYREEGCRDTLGPHPASGGALATFPCRGRHPAPSLPPRGCARRRVSERNRCRRLLARRLKVPPQRRMRADLALHPVRCPARADTANRAFTPAAQPHFSCVCAAPCPRCTYPVQSEQPSLKNLRFFTVTRCFQSPMGSPPLGFLPGRSITNKRPSALVFHHFPPSLKTAHSSS